MKNIYNKNFFYQRLESGRNNFIFVWVIPFPVLKNNLELLKSNEKHFIKEVFDQRPGSGRKNSIIVWIIPFPVLKINFETLG